MEYYSNGMYLSYNVNQWRFTGHVIGFNGDLLEMSWDVEWLDLQAGAPKRYRYVGFVQ